MTTLLVCEPFGSVADVIARGDCGLNGEDDLDLINDALDAASDMLYVLSNGRVTGQCFATVRPLNRGDCFGGFGTDLYADPMYQRYGVDCIPLPRNTISVDAVKIDGVTLGVGDYGLLDGYLLYRIDKMFWPRSNNLRLADTEVGTWSVRFSWGNPADWLADQATVDMAISLIDDYQNGKGYLRGVTSANVQGVSVQLEEAAGEMSGRGLPMLERFLSVHAPHGGLPVGAWSPEVENGWTLVQREGPSGS